MAITIPTNREFAKWPKTERLSNVRLAITEKIDGTNCHIVVGEDRKIVAVGSRNRYITPGKTTDNYGFAAWVEANEETLANLGPGVHYGEWYGQGIGRGYGMAERRFALFDYWRYPYLSDFIKEGRIPANVEVVPILYCGAFSMEKVTEVTNLLNVHGSVAVPGWMQPEGFVTAIGMTRYKTVFDKHGPSPEE